MVILLDSNGNELAICIEQSVPGSNRLVMSRVLRGRGNLVKYYFGQGLRSVQVQSGGFLLRGVLETAWLGAERQWAVRPTPIAVRDDARAIESDGKRSA